MNEEIKKEVKTLTPFRRFCMTIGELPTSYIETMTYYEMLMWFTKYLSETVIPAVNNNAEAVTELQALFVVLQNYVNDYFDNLDIQTEVDNKLDEMAESGELAEIIAQYLEVASVLGFDTKASLKSADNLVNGSIVRTLGETTYNDGKGSYYKIRTITSSDVIDDNNILALANFPTLIAEKIIDYYLNKLDNDLNNKINQIEIFQNRKYLFVGDSYATGYQGENVDPIEGYFTKVKNKFNLNAQIIAHNGSGFLGMNNNNKWITWLTNETIPNKETFTDVIICGGMNDSDNSTDLRNAMEECINYIKNNFPNALIHIGCVGRYKEGTNAQLERVRKVDRLYKIIATQNGCKYIDGSFLLLHHRDWYISTDNIHPNTSGESQLAYGIEQYLINGEIVDFCDITSAFDYKTDTITPATGVTMTPYIYSSIDKNTCTLFFSGDITFTTHVNMSNLTDVIIGKLSSSYICSSSNNQGISEFVTGYVYSVNTINNSHFVKVSARLYNDSYNNLHLKFFTVKDDGNILNNIEISQFSMPYGTLRLSCDSRMC